MTKWYT